jgi:hypothetical protein
MLVNRRLTVFLGCLLIATLFWLSLSLSDIYSATMTFPVRYTHLPEKKVITNDLPAEISVDMRTTGYRILHYAFTSSPAPVEIDVTAGLSSSGVNSDVVVVPARNFLRDFSRQLGDEVQVTGLRPDSIVLMFEERIYRKVPVRPDFHFDLRRQFDTVSGPVVFPDSATVSGPPSAIAKIHEIKTATVRISDLQRPVDTTVVLRKPPLIDLVPHAVRLKLQVEKFTEGLVKVSVTPVNVPVGYEMRTFPDQVMVRYQAALSGFSSVTGDQFEVAVDAQRISGSELNILPLTLIDQPPNVRSVTLEPAEVEFILKKK